MFLSFFYKEFVKMKWFFASLIVLSLIYLVWIFLQIQKLFKLDHSEIVWYRVISLEQVPFENLIYLPLFCGAVFAFFQFLLEKKDERFRLSLHLPLDNSYIIIAHLLIGILFLGFIFVFGDFLIYLFLSAYFPQSYAISAICAISTWFLAGLVLYLCVSILLLEPQKSMRFLLLLVFVGIFIPIYQYQKIEQLQSFLGIYALLIPLLILASVISIFHFRLRIS